MKGGSNVCLFMINQQNRISGFTTLFMEEYLNPSQTFIHVFHDEYIIN